MAAHEEQDEGVVRVEAQFGFGWDHERLGRGFERDGILAPAPRRLAPHVVGQAPPGDLVEPAARIARQARDRPLLRRRDQRFLYRVLRRREIAVATGEGAEDLRGQVTQEAENARPPATVRSSPREPRSAY